MLTHPAVAVADEWAADLDGEFTAQAIRTRDDVAAVVMDSAAARYVIIMTQRDGRWLAPGMVNGSPRPDGPRAGRTPDYRPLQRLSSKRTITLADDGTQPDHVWFSVTGLAAEDAIEISIVTRDVEIREPIGEDGLAFAVARVPCGENPDVYVHTQDGRRIAARH